jgi:hypothetical protein
MAARAFVDFLGETLASDSEHFAPSLQLKYPG